MADPVRGAAGWRSPGPLPRPGRRPSAVSVHHAGRASRPLLWIGGSALFALYAAGFASYNKTWGSLAGVIVTLTWLWLNAVSILFAAEVNAEVERAREVRGGTPPEATLTAPHR